MPLTASGETPTVFDVSDVEPARKPISTSIFDTPKDDAKAIIEMASHYPVEYANPWTGKLIQTYSNPLLHAVEAAWSRHYPLVLSPDAIWLTIARGFAQHVRFFSDDLRSKLVSFAGKRDVISLRDDFVPGSPDNPWDEVIDDFANGVAREIPALASWVVCDFTTTGARERVASQLVMLDAASPYLNYVMIGICGIPQIGMTGTTADWESIERRIENLAAFGLDWWLPALRRILRQCVNATKGLVDREFWAGIFTQNRGCVGDNTMNGWIGQLFPYLEGDKPRQNPLVANVDSKERLSVSSFPWGLTRVPFVAHYNGTKVDMQFLSGFVGMRQDDATLALSPVIGWAVCNCSRGRTRHGEELKHHEDWLEQRARAEQKETPRTSRTSKKRRGR